MDGVSRGMAGYPTALDGVSRGMDGVCSVKLPSRAGAAEIAEAVKMW